MEKAGDFLGKMLRRLDCPKAVLPWVSSAWPSIVGAALAAHTRPLRLKAGCLELSADSKPWQKQLETMQRELCARVNESWGAALIHEVKFVASAPSVVPAISLESDNNHIPFIRRRRG
jgi:predicted nucleic acid-binding Zn ribbon protein